MVKLDFPVFEERLDVVNNYDLYFMPRGIYRAKEVKADNYLYPMYYIKEGDDYIVSTSAYALIRYKNRFIRNTRFHSTYMYRPTFRTLDEEVMRVRTTPRRSTRELTDKDEITSLAARLIQDYVTEIEDKYPGWVHILLMGGKDSGNIILAKRKARWVVVTGDPNAVGNKKYLKDNNIKVDRLITLNDEEQIETTFMPQEILASDCICDSGHLRWVKVLNELIKEYDRKVVLWMGSAGDVIFKPNNNLKDKDYFAIFDLQLGMLNGIWHQMYKNLFDIPVVSPYQSPRFLNELFYHFDPNFVTKSGEVRPEIGQKIFGGPVKDPAKNIRLAYRTSKRDYSQAIPMYISQLKKEGIPCKTKDIKSWINAKIEKFIYFLDRNSIRPKRLHTRILFFLRNHISKIIPALQSRRHDIVAREIK